MVLVPPSDTVNACGWAVMGFAVSTTDPRFRALLDELSVVRPDGPSPFGVAIRQLRELSRVDSIVCIELVQSTMGWALDGFYADNLPNASRFRLLVSSYLSRGGKLGWFDAAKPELAQRNVLVDIRDKVSAAELEASAIYTQLLQPLHLHRHHVVRALICDDDRLVAWLGAFHSSPVEQAQLDVLDAAIPALQRRLVMDRQIESAPLVNAALEAVLEQIAGPALIVSAGGRIHEVNVAGRALLETKRAELSASILAALAGEAPTLPVELVRLDTHGVNDHWLAVVRTRSADSRAALAIARASARLKLTRRQREVLGRVVLGESNAAIAAALKITERAVEQHVTALFDRAAVDSRAALVTFVLLG